MQPHVQEPGAGREPSPSVAWSAAIFAHNEARRIHRAIECVEDGAAGQALAITVLANGCTDRTGDAVREMGKSRPYLRLIEIDLPDKANAWNVYVHDSHTPDRSAEIRVHFFVDGDVCVGPKAFVALARALDEVPSANGAGGLPTSGRDQQAWRARMAARGTLAGGLYALRGRFVERIRAQSIRIPVGFIGEDWLVSFLAGTDLGADPASTQAPLVVFSPDAGFSFRSLNPLVPWDSTRYLRRLWRYALRDVQFEMLMRLLGEGPLTAMPPDVHDLYRQCLPPSRLKWVGRRTLFRTLAVQQVRNLRSRASQKHA